MATRSRWRMVAALVGVVIVLAVPGHRLLMHPTVPGTCDHPYKYAQQRSFDDAVADHRDPVGVDFRFSGGYPELQLYPVGPAALGAMLAALPAVSSEGAYWLVLVVAWFLPGLAAAAAVLLARGHPAVAWTSGCLVGLATFGYSGTYVGVGCGALAARLSLSGMVIAAGLMVAVSVMGRGRRRSAAVIALAAAVAWTATFHLYFLPVSVVLLGSLGVLHRRRGDPGAKAAMMAAGGGLAVAGGWWVGAVILGGMAVPYRAGADVGLVLVTTPQFSQGYDWWLIAGGAVASLVVVVVRRVWAEPPFVLIAGLVPVVVVSAVGAVMELVFHLRFFPTSRLFDAVILWSALVAPIGLQALAALVHQPARLAAACVAVAAVWIALEAPVVLPPNLDRSLAEVEADGPTALWATLRNGSGRVVVTGSYFEEGHVLGLSSEESGREVVNGGPSVASPMQALLAAGPGASSIEGFGTQHDNVDLLGLAWTDVEHRRDVARTLADRLGALGITQLVVGPARMDDSAVLAGLRAHPDLFDEGETVGPFTLFSVRGVDPARVTATFPGAVVDHTEASDDRAVATVDSETGGEIVAHIQRSPLWSVTVDGESVPVAEDDYRQIVVRVPPGRHTVEITQVTPPLLTWARLGLLLVGIAMVVVAGRVGDQSLVRTDPAGPD